MPSQKIFLDEAKTQQLEVNWSGFWKNAVVTLNGVELARFADRSELKAGREMMLQDGRMLRVWLDSGIFSTQGLMYSINGQPIKGSGGDPEVILKSIFILAVILGSLNLILGLVAEFLESEFLLMLGINWIVSVVGIVIGGLGFAVWKLRSVAALIILIAIFVLDIVLAAWLSIEAGAKNPPTTYFVIKVLFIVQFVRGFRALRQVNAM